MKTIVTIYGEKDKTELKFDKNFLFHTILHFSQLIHENMNRIYEIDKRISFRKNDMIHLKCDFFDENLVKCKRLYLDLHSM